MADKKYLDLPLEDLIELDNIAEELDGETLSTIASRVVEDYTTDNLSRKDWLGRYNHALKLALQVRENKTYPWRNASNVKYPLMTIAAMQFHARAYPMLIPSKNVAMTRVLGTDPLGEKGDRAQRVQMHMNYQLYDEMQDWEEGMDRLLVTVPLTGSEFKKIYYDNQKGTNCSELVYAKDLVVHYYAKSLKDAARVTELVNLSNNELLTNIRSGLFSDCFKDMDQMPTGVPKDQPEVTEVTNKTQGLEAPKADDDTPHLVLEWHGYLDLDGDGYKEPYIVTVHKELQKVLRIVARFQADNIEYNADDEVVKIVPDQYYHQYTFIPSPDGGIYGMGFGTLVGPVNDAVNTLINQLIDSGTLATLQSGFISKHLRMKGGMQSFQPGEWKQVNVAGQDIKAGLFPLPTKEPSSTLFNLLSFLVAAGERLTSTTDIMVGENPGQNQKATTTQAVVEQGQKVFTAIYKRIRHSMSKEFKMLYDLNSIYLEDEVYYDWYTEVEGLPEDLQVLRDDYVKGGFTVIPTADPNAVSQLQKLEKLQAVGQLLQLQTIDPLEYTKRYLDALEVENPTKLMPPPKAGPSPQEQLQQLMLNMEIENHQIDNMIKMREQKRKEMETQAKIADQASQEHERSNRLQLDALSAGVEAAKDVKKDKEKANKPEKKPKK